MARDLLLRRARKVSRPPGCEESEKMQRAWGWQSPRINSQGPVWAMAAGSCGRHVGYTSTHAHAAVYSKWDHNGRCLCALLSLFMCLVNRQVVFSFPWSNHSIAACMCGGVTSSTPPSPPCSCWVDGTRSDTSVAPAPETQTTQADRCCSRAIFLTTGQQKSSHASDKGA